MDILILLRVIVIGLVIIGAILALIRKIALKRSLEAGLGREVEGRELTDIGAWMNAIPADGEKHVTAPAKALRRKHGDVISLGLGVLGLLALAVSIPVSRATHTTTMFAAAVFGGIVFVIIGLPLGLIAKGRAKRFPGTYKSTRPALLGIVANVALGLGVVLLVTGGRTVDNLLRPDIQDVDLSAYTKPTKNDSPETKRKNLLPTIDVWFKAKNQPLVTTAAVGDKQDQLRINLPSLKKDIADALAKQFIVEKGKELTAAGFANNFQLTDLGKLSLNYQFKSFDQVARETMLPITELWFASKQIKAKAAFDKNGDTTVVISSASFDDDNESLLSTQFSVANGKQMKGFGFQKDFIVTNGQQSWTHQLY